jgi:peptide deformylase
MKILQHPDIFLRQKSQEIKIPLSQEDMKLIEDMKATMYGSNGVGLAAIQVGYQKRIAIVDTSKSKNNPIILINPKLIYQSDLTLTGEEGCLSTPGQFANVPRQTRIKVEYHCGHEKKLCKTFYNVEAIVIQHELDHMDGKLCIDYKPILKREK